MRHTLERGIRYIVAKGSDDETLAVGDHIWIDGNDCLCSREGQGWIDPEDVAEVLIGVQVAIDKQWLATRTQKVISDIVELRRLLFLSDSKVQLPELSDMTVGNLEAIAGDLGS